MTAAGGFAVGMTALDRLMPMHLCLSGTGAVLSAGPTLAKIAGAPLAGGAFFDLFEIRQPGGIATPGDLARRAGARLYLNLRAVPETGLRGLAMPLQGGGPEGRGQENGGLILNLSFGIDLAQAVRDHALTDTDFAATDLAVELLYLVEAKSAVMAELRDLNRRLQGARIAAEEQAQTDTLTGLYNRRAMDRIMAEVAAKATPFGLMHVDLDYFKQVNDTLGHAAGDHVLREVARALRAETRTGDMLARVGGDEFVIMFPGLTDPAAMEVIARRMIDRLSRPIPYRDRDCSISASIGMTASTLYDAPDPDRMLADADRALYVAKRGGRAGVAMHRPKARGG